MPYVRNTNTTRAEDVWCSTTMQRETSTEILIGGRNLASIVRQPTRADTAGENGHRCQKRSKSPAWQADREQRGGNEAALPRVMHHPDALRSVIRALGQRAIAARWVASATSKSSTPATCSTM
jgi:hypothetical protein